MKIGIIGSGNIGGTLGRAWAGAGHEVMFSYSRHRETLDALASSIGPMGRAGSPSDAVAFGDAVLLSVPWPQVEDAIRAAGDLSGHVLLDTTNPYVRPGGPLAIDLAVTSAADQVGDMARGSRLVKAFNTLYYVTLSEKAGLGLGLPISGDDEAAVALATELVRDAGFDPVVIGGLDGVARQEPGGPLYSRELDAGAIRAAVLTPASTAVAPD